MRLNMGNKNMPDGYSSWSGMRTRCNNPNNKDWDNYGGRGITVCDRWNNFKAFISDMGERPSKFHSVDRIDNNKGYSPDNCKWATMAEQASNKRTTLSIKWMDIELSSAEWSRVFEIPRSRITERIASGWTDVEEILFSRPLSNHRKSVGETHHKAKLKSGDIEKIFELRKNGKSQQRIADMFGVTQSTISAALRGSTWKSLHR